MEFKFMVAIGVEADDERTAADDLQKTLEGALLSESSRMVSFTVPAKAEPTDQET